MYYTVAPEKTLFFQPQNIGIFLISAQKHIWVLISSALASTSMSKALLMSTHNICLSTEIRKKHINLFITWFIRTWFWILHGPKMDKIKSIDYINDHKGSFFCIIFTFLFGYNTVV